MLGVLWGVFWSVQGPTQPSPALLSGWGLGMLVGSRVKASAGPQGSWLVLSSVTKSVCCGGPYSYRKKDVLTWHGGHFQKWWAETSVGSPLRSDLDVVSRAGWPFVQLTGEGFVQVFDPFCVVCRYSWVVGAPSTPFIPALRWTRGLYFLFSVLVQCSLLMSSFSISDFCVLPKKSCLF